MANNHESAHHQIVIAEFEALRAEIIQRMSLQWNIFALQLTAAGVVFSFALSNPAHIGFLLILPVITYALTGRYVSQYHGTQKIGTYIREVIEPKVNEELHWEEWQRSQRPRERTLSWLNPLFLTFPGVSLIALAWAASYVWESPGTSPGKRTLIVIIWFLGIGVTGLSFQLIGRIASFHWLRNFRKRTNQSVAPVVHDKTFTGQGPSAGSTRTDYADPPVASGGNESEV